MDKQDVSIREASIEDAELLFKWRNDPEIMNLGSSRRNVDWEEHQTWIINSLSNNIRNIFIITANEYPIGQVRFDHRENGYETVISIYLISSHRRKGFGVRVIVRSSNLIFEKKPQLLKIIAIIREDNPKSISAFTNAGFSRYLSSKTPVSHISMARYRVQKSSYYDPTITFYEDLVSQYGNDFRSLNWGSLSSQIKRFEILTEPVLKKNKQVSILDIGCGTGDLYSHLIEQNVPVSYNGIDLTPGMINIAKERFPNTNFEIRNFIDKPYGPFDYILCSGVFAYSDFTFMKTLILSGFDNSNICFAFNSLSSLAKEKVSSEFYADPSDVLRFCLSLSPWVVLRHEYHPNDFTVYVFKNRQ
jgi:RimJ/RimL family protein N-acetyltransferase